MTFKITKDTVQQIFSEKPHIKLAYQLRVPHTLDEKTFWQRYLKYLARCKVQHMLPHAHLSLLLLSSNWQSLQTASKNNVVRCQARQKKAGAAEHDDDEDEAIFGEDRAASNAEMRKRIKHVDPSVNIAADQFESFETGYGTAHSGRQVCYSTLHQASFILYGFSCHACHSLAKVIGSARDCCSAGSKILWARHWSCRGHVSRSQSTCCSRGGGDA